MAEDNELQELRDKLAIAEELLIAGCHMSAGLKDVSVWWELPYFYGQRRGVSHDEEPLVGVAVPDLTRWPAQMIDCIRQARQKLAAERVEAAKGNREEKMKKALERIRDLDWRQFNCPFEQYRFIASQALES